MLTAFALCSMTVAPGLAFATDGAAPNEGAPGQNGEARPASEKSEIVYLHADASGNVAKTEVETVLRNDEEAGRLTDASTLSDIKGADENQKFSGPAESMVWDAQGADVSYKGTSSEEAPLSVAVTYTLDDEEVSPEEAAGKSGRMVIHYEYTNSTASFGDFTPFVMVTYLPLDDNVFSNVEVEGGTVTKEGDKTFVIGYGMPGLIESLLSDDEFNGYDDELGIYLDEGVTDYFEISADVKDFSLSESLTMATPDPLDFLEEGDFDFGELGDLPRELSDGVAKMSQGVDSIGLGLDDIDGGARTLASGIQGIADGVVKLAGQMPNLSTGVEQLYGGSQKVVSGLSGTVEGIGDAATGAVDLVEGLERVVGEKGVSGLMASVAGALELELAAANLESGLGLLTGDDALPAVQEGVDLIAVEAYALAAELDSEELQDLADLLGYSTLELTGNQAIITDLKADAEATIKAAGDTSSDIATVKALLEGIDISKIEDEDTKTKIADAKNALESAEGNADAANTAAADLADAEDLETVSTELAIDALEASDLSEAQALAEGIGDDAVAASGKLDTAIDGAYDLATGIYALEDGAANLADGLQTAVDSLSNDIIPGARTIAEGLVKLSDKDNGLPMVAKGAEGLRDGLGTISNSMGALSDGASTLGGGAQQVANGAWGLADGVTNIHSGIVSIADGVKTLSEGTVAEIVSFLDESLRGIANVLAVLSDFDTTYSNFAGKAASTPSTVRFVFQLAGIPKD